VLRHSSDVKEEWQRTEIDREHVTTAGNGRMALGLRGPKNLNEDINKFWHGSPPYI
jgi:hypothetical protein